MCVCVLLQGVGARGIDMSTHCAGIYFPTTPYPMYDFKHKSTIIVYMYYTMDSKLPYSCMPVIPNMRLSQALKVTLVMCATS